MRAKNAHAYSNDCPPIEKQAQLNYFDVNTLSNTTFPFGKKAPVFSFRTVIQLQKLNVVVYEDWNNVGRFVAAALNKYQFTVNDRAGMGERKRCWCPMWENI